MGATRNQPQHSPRYRRLCRLLKQWREQAELTQRGLAKKLEKPHSYVSKSEWGDRRIDPVELLDWCAACEVDAHIAIDELLKL